MEDSSNLLYIPYHRSDSIKIYQAFKDIISKDFYQSATLFEKDLQDINSLRDKYIAIINSEGNNIDYSNFVNQLKNYYNQLCSISKKFPNNEIEFTYYSNDLTYQSSKKTILKSFNFEKLNVLYNIGSFFSIYAFKQSRDDDIGLKNSCLYFQYSAGCFEFIESFSEKIDDFQIPLEYSSEIVSGLKNLMLAQAQETFWQKARKDGLNVSVIAKLSAQVASYYEMSFDSLNKSQFLLKAKIMNHILLKKFHFRAVANYRTSLNYLNKFKYGEQIAHLKIAFEESNNGLEYSKNVSTKVVNELQNFNKIVKESLTTAERDNNLIYLVHVPAAKDLKPIIGASMVKTLIPADFENPIKILKESNQKLLFENLLPYIVIKTSQAFKERQQEFVDKNLINPINQLNKMLKDFLNERNLPSSIDSISKPQSLPDNVLLNCSELAKQGGCLRLQKAMDELNKLSSKSNDLIVNCRERMKFEAEEDAALRRKYGKAWNRDPSELEGLFLKIEKFETYLNQAKDGDNVIKEQINSLVPYVKLMTEVDSPSGKEELKNFIPASKVVNLDQNILSSINNLNELINKAKKLIDRNCQFIENLHLKSENLNILSILISEYKKNLSQIEEEKSLDESSFESVYEKNVLKLFDSDFADLQSFKNEQINLEKKIDKENEIFLSRSSSYLQNVNEKRANSLKILEEAFDGYSEILNNLSQGKTFYNNFVNTITCELIAECDQFAFARKKLETSLEDQMAHQKTSHLKQQKLTSNSMPKTQTLEVEDENNNDNDNSIDSNESMVHKVNKNSGEEGEVNSQSKENAAHSGLWKPSAGIKFD